MHILIYWVTFAKIQFHKYMVKNLYTDCYLHVFCPIRFSSCEVITFSAMQFDIPLNFGVNDLCFGVRGKGSIPCLQMR